MAETPRHIHTTHPSRDQHDAQASGESLGTTDHSLARRASVGDTTLFICLGSAHGDDQAGWIVAEELERLLAGRSCAVTIRALSSPLDLIGELDHIEHLIVCDACDAECSEANQSPCSPGPCGLEDSQTFANRPTHEGSDYSALLTVGQRHRWTWPTDDLLRTRSSNSHQLGLTEVLSLAATLRRLPPVVEICGIGGGEFRPGSEPSPLVRAACQQLATQLSKEFARA